VPESFDAVQVAAVFLLGLFCIVLAVVLLRPLWLPVWHLFRRTQQFLEDWFGEPARDGYEGRPGAMARLRSVEKELHPNGGGSFVDRISAEVRAVGQQVAGVQESAQQATTAAGLAVNEAKVAAQVAQETATERRQDVQRLETSLTDVRSEIAARDEAYEVRAAERMADAFDLLAEVTMHRPAGPIRLPKPGEVAPHAHTLPAQDEALKTSGPVEPDETRSEQS